MVADKFPSTAFHVVQVPCNGAYIDMELLFKKISATYLIKNYIV